jgi:hypothetical protein
MFALFAAYFLCGVTQAKVSQRPPIAYTSYSFNRLRVMITADVFLKSLFKFRSFTQLIPSSNLKDWNL